MLKTISLILLSTIFAGCGPIFDGKAKIGGGPEPTAVTQIDPSCYEAQNFMGASNQYLVDGNHLTPVDDYQVEIDLRIRLIMSLKAGQAASIAICDKQGTRYCAIAKASYTIDYSNEWIKVNGYDSSITDFADGQCVANIASDYVHFMTRDGLKFLNDGMYRKFRDLTRISDL
ncbi:MAG: hypothetical protein AB8E15_00745 [Bdellovibrionales bacterium]